MNEEGRETYERHSYAYRISWADLSEETKNFWREVAEREKNRKPEAK